MDERRRIGCVVLMGGNMECLKTESCFPSLKQFHASLPICRLAVLVILVLPAWTATHAQGPSSGETIPAAESSSRQPPEAPSASAENNAESFDALANIGRTIGQDELHIIKAPLQKSAIKWDILMVVATGALIATDERVLHQVPASWHQTSINISDAGVYGVAAITGGIYLTGLITKNKHAQETGIRTAEAAVDSVILFTAMKAILQRQRPYTGAGEGRFLSGDWSNGSFPSGHAMFTWTLASTVAHEYHSVPLDLLMYGIATTVSTTRVTAGQHFPADVFVGSVFGYLIGDYVAHKPASGFPTRGGSLFRRVPDAVLQHVTIGIE